MPDPGGVQILQLILLVGLRHHPLVEVPISSSKRLGSDISALVWILTVVSTPSPSSPTSLPWLQWLQLLLARCSGVASVPVLTSGLGLLARCWSGRRVLLLAALFSSRSDVEPEHERALVLDAHSTIKRCPLALYPVVAPRLFSDSDVPTASPTSCWCPVEVASSPFEHTRLDLFLLRDFGRLCCTTSCEDVLAVLVSLLQLPQTHVAGGYTAVGKLVEMLIRVERVQPGRTEVAEVRLALVTNPEHSRLV